MDKPWLRALEPDDYIYTHQWRLDHVTWSAVAGVKKFVSLETERRWLLNAIERHEKCEVLRFVVCLGSNSEPRGLISATSIDFINSSCELSSILSPECRNIGIIQQSWLLVYHYLFAHLGLHRVGCLILFDNIASRRAHIKFGLKEEGILRQSVFKDGAYKDLISYSMLSHEFYNLHSSNL